jgi:hypothetical protein
VHALRKIIHPPRLPELHPVMPGEGTLLSIRYGTVQYCRICHYRFGKKGRKTGWRTGGVWSLRSPDQTAFSREAPPVLLSSQCTVNLGRATLIGQQLLAKECLAPCLCTLHLPLHSSWTTPPLAPRKSRPPNNYSLNAEHHHTESMNLSRVERIVASRIHAP